MVAARFEGIHEALDEEAMKLVEDKKKKLEIELKAHSAILLSLRDEDTLTTTEVKAVLNSKELQKKGDEGGDSNGEGLLIGKGKFPKNHKENQSHHKPNQSRTGAKGSAVGSNSRGNNGKQCFYCKKEGHFRDECFALKAKLKRDSQQLGTRNHGEADLVDGCETADVLVAPSSDSSGELVLDSGYSFHMTPNRELLSSFLEEHSGTVLLSNNKACAI
uniref:CCHC-type domain-containing protein n=1 Tax=Cannabis sativa TaxID=3483 RepID=A0A803Q352_CANSA